MDVTHSYSALQLPCASLQDSVVRKLLVDRWPHEYAGVRVGDQSTLEPLTPPIPVCSRAPLATLLTTSPMEFRCAQTGLTRIIAAYPSQSLGTGAMPAPVKKRANESCGTHCCGASQP